MRTRRPVLDQDALYYPYIHIRDTAWLKATMVLFPHVVRIVPMGFDPKDDPEVRVLSETAGRRGPLLRRANMNSSSVEKARRKILEEFEEEIEKDLPTLQHRFGREAVERIKSADPFGVQIHIDKAPEIIDLLKRYGLAWAPRQPEPDEPDRYIEVHPCVGEAIMTTLAIACAKDEGLQIVTENGKLHRCLAEHRSEDVFRTWIKNAGDETWRDNRPREFRLALTVCEKLNISRLTPRSLAALSNEWEARGTFLGELRNLSDSIPEMDNEARLQERLQDLASDALERWEDDKANLSPTIRQMFASGASTEVGAAAKKIADHIAGPAVVGASGLILGGLTHGNLLAAGAGVAIGVCIQTWNAWRRSRAREKRSPYRYLTLVQKAALGYSVGR